MNGSLCLSGGTVLAMEDDAVPPPTDVWVKDGCISALVPAGSAAPWTGPVQHIDARGMAVMPGLVNAHTHSASALHRGRIQGAPLDLFVMEAISRRTDRSPRAVYVSAAIHACEMLRNGVTGCVDHLRHGLLPAPEAVDAALLAFLDAGMRAAVAPMFEDRMYLESLPLDTHALSESTRQRWGNLRRPPIGDYFDMMDTVRRAWEARSDRISLLLGVDGPQRCTPELLERTGDYARRHRMGLHTHLLEAKTQALVAAAGHGSFVALLHKYGLVKPASSFAHFVWCTPEDIELAADLGVNIVHNPASNLHLGSGVQPTAQLLACGVHVGLGSDGVGNGRPSLFEQVRLASLLSRISETDCDRWIQARQALRLATAGGARVLRQDGLLGTVQLGAPADLVLVDLKAPAHQPLVDPYNSLALYETGQNVRYVIVDGQVVVREGRVTTVDEDALLEEAAALAAADVASSAQGEATSARERREFHPLILQALRRPLPLHRFVGAAEDGPKALREATPLTGRTVP